MPAPADSIDRKLDEKHEELRQHEDAIERLKRQIEVVHVEIATWKEARRLVTESSVVISDRVIKPRSAPQVHVRDSRRGPKGAWRNLMPEMLRQYPSGAFTLGDVEAASELGGCGLKGPTIRSQMSNYTKNGLLDRIAHGKFTFTDKGREAFASLSNKPSELRLVTNAPVADDAQATGVRGGDIPRASSDVVSGGGG